MDVAVSLVQTYLRVNGYFTVSEYPVVEALRRGGYRTVTDLDILAFRFPGAGRSILGQDKATFAPDPALGVPPESPDMIIGEVKEGIAEFNAAAEDPEVIEFVLEKFGCCHASELSGVVTRLFRRGQAKLPNGHQVRLLAFASAPPKSRRIKSISLAHVRAFLQEYIREHWEQIKPAQFKDSVLGFLVALEKAERASPLWPRA